MKIGYFCNTTNWTHKPYDILLDEAREITEYCDQNKWNSIWYTEHHFNHEGMESLTNPLMMGVDAAARTKNIRIGQACNVITFHNPIRMAEDIALLDQLSKGRVEIGIGRGIYGREAINLKTTDPTFVYEITTSYVSLYKLILLLLSLIFNKFFQRLVKKFFIN